MASVRLRLSARTSSSGPTTLAPIRTYATPEALLESESGLDFVDIVTPPHLHGRQTIAALERGLHVLCEKPLSLASEELEEASRLARKRGRVIFPVHNWKYAPLFRKLSELVRARAVGSIRHIEWHTLRTRPAAVALKAKGIISANITSARGIGKITPLKYRGVGGQTEKEVLDVLVDAERAEEIFEFIYFEAQIDRPHGGLMYMGALHQATSFVLPDLPEEA